MTGIEIWKGSARDELGGSRIKDCLGYEVYLGKGGIEKRE